jgi:hypothetical protein
MCSLTSIRRVYIILQVFSKTQQKVMYLHPTDALFQSHGREQRHNKGKSVPQHMYCG